MSDTHIPGLPEKYTDVPGVQFNPPPAQYMDQTLGVISAAVAKLKPGEKGKLVWIVTTNGKQYAVNAAIVNKFDAKIAGKQFDFEVTQWIGKKWNAPIEAGIAGSVSWS